MNCALESSIRRLASERIRIAASSACATISRARAFAPSSISAERRSAEAIVCESSCSLAAEVLDLVARGLELALEVAVSVAQRLEIVVELAERQAQLGERELDVLATVAAAEALVAQGWPLISVRSAH